MFGIDFELPSLGDVGGWLFGTSGTATTPGTQGAFLPLLQGGLATIGALSGPETGYSDTKAGFDDKLALEREKLAQEMAIAQLQAQSAGAGSGAALEAARIAARVRMAEIRDKQLADRIALKLKIARGEPELLQQGYEMMQRGAENTGAAGLSGYNQAARVLQGFRV